MRDYWDTHNLPGGLDRSWTHYDHSEPPNMAPEDAHIAEIVKLTEMIDELRAQNARLRALNEELQQDITALIRMNGEG